MNRRDADVVASVPENARLRAGRAQGAAVGRGQNEWERAEWEQAGRGRGAEAVAAAHAEPEKAGALKSARMLAARRKYLAFEFGVLFFGIPAWLALADGVARVLPTLWAATIAAFYMLWRDPTFDRKQLWSTAEVRRGLPRVLGVWLLLCGLLSIQVWYFRPDWWLSFPRDHTRTWLLVMVGYPVVSVIAQNVLYRAFIFHRYPDLFGKTGTSMVWASAAAFSFGHVIFLNWLALTLTGIAGLVFAMTYDKHRSVVLSTIEHALYGCVIFTIGLGQFVKGV